MLLTHRVDEISFLKSFSHDRPQARTQHKELPLHIVELLKCSRFDSSSGRRIMAVPKTVTSDLGCP
jgi:hypothetical protein